MAKRLIDPPDVLPVTLETAKIHERIDIDDAENDAYIEAQLAASVNLAQEFTRRAFITQQWEFQTNKVCQVIQLPRPPLISVDEVVTVSRDGTETVMDADNYLVDVISQPGRVIFNNGIPGITNTIFDTVYATSPYPVIRIKFTAGYGDDGESVPPQIKQGILQCFGHLYENRESQQMPPEAISLLMPYKVWFT